MCSVLLSMPAPADAASAAACVEARAACVLHQSTSRQWGLVHHCNAFNFVFHALHCSLSMRTRLRRTGHAWATLRPAWLSFAAAQHCCAVRPFGSRWIHGAARLPHSLQGALASPAMGQGSALRAIEMNRAECSAFAAGRSCKGCGEPRQRRARGLGGSSGKGVA